MSFPTIPVAAIGDDHTAVVQNNVYAMITALLSPPSVNAYNSAGLTSVASGTATLVPLDSELWDEDWGPGTTGTFHSTATNTSRIVFPYTGTYEIFFAWQWASAPGIGNSAVNLRLNSGGSSSGGSSLRTPIKGADRTDSFPLRRYFTAGDYAELFVQQSSGGAITASGGAHVLYVSALYIGA